MSKPITDRGVEKKSERLAGKRVAIGLCGGIGAVEGVKIIRELRRHGAEVQPFVTPEVARFITPLSLSWAAGREAIGTPGADVDHLSDFDAVLVVPATLNTLAKAAAGICDNAVTLLIAGQLGAGAPIGFCPAMNDRLRAHPMYGEAKQKLVSWGARVWEPASAEGRMKAPAPEQALKYVEELLS